MSNAVPGAAKRHPRLALGSLLALALVAILAGPVLHRSVRAAKPVVPYPHELARVSFAVAGDVIPHEAVRAAAAAEGPDLQGWTALFSDVADVFHTADFGFVNMETPVAPNHSKGSKPFMFDAPV